MKTARLIDEIELLAGVIWLLDEAQYLIGQRGGRRQALERIAGAEVVLLDRKRRMLEAALSDLLPQYSALCWNNEGTRALVRELVENMAARGAE